MNHSFAAWVLLASCVFLAFGASADVYKWVDDRGVPHLSDSPSLVPPEYRDRIEVIRRDPAPEETEAGDPAETDASPVPDAEEAPPGNFSFNPTGEAAELDPAEIDPAEMDPAELMGSAGLQMLMDNLPALSGGFIAVFGIAMLALMVIGLAISGGLLILASRMGGQEPPSLGLAMGMSFLGSVANFVLSAVTLGLAVVSQDPNLLIVANGLSLVLGIAAQIAIFRVMHCESLGGAIVLFLLWMVTFVLATVALLIVGFLFAAIF
ncbi:MAG: DUF4124 domain-containing protein [Proteobacteria bacterium]|nr:DUF4124 domain-containing protein [Pseudomonadota bacterium]